MERVPSVNEGSEALDAKWYHRLEALMFEDYSKFEGRKEAREIAKAEFLSGVVENPELDYPLLQDFDIETREEELLALKSEILNEEPNQAVGKIYRTKINEFLASLRMLQAAKDGDDRKFERYSDFIYGKPNDSSLAYVGKVLKKKTKIKEDNSAYKKAAKGRIAYLVELLPKDSEEEFDESLFSKGVEIEGFVSSEGEAVEAFTGALNSYGIDDWEVVVDRESGLTNFSVSQEEKVIKIPEGESLVSRNLSRQKMQGLIAHEVGTHALRRYNGERTKLKLLGIGLDRYIKGEEGVATYNEQQITGAKEFAGVPKYFAIAVAKGFDGKPRDFRGTFNIMCDYYASVLKDGEDLEERAKNAAWRDCVRIFRGTTCNRPGAVFAKDLVYLEGNKETWHLVSKDSDVVQTFTIGKFDPANKNHISLLSEIGILDNDLDGLSTIN